MGEERAEPIKSPTSGESFSALRIPNFISVFSSDFGILAPSSSCSFRDNGLETISPLVKVVDVMDVTLPDFIFRRGELPKEGAWSAGEEKEGVCGDTGMLSSFGLALRAGEGIRACKGLVLFPKDEEGRGDWLEIARPDGSLGLGVRAGEKAVFAASDGVFLELSLGLGVTAKGEVGVFNEETDDRVMIGNEDGGEEPKLIKARLAPKPGSRSGLELGSGGVWVTGRPLPS